MQQQQFEQQRYEQQEQHPFAFAESSFTPVISQPSSYQSIQLPEQNFPHRMLSLQNSLHQSHNIEIEPSLEGFSPQVDQSVLPTQKY